MYECWPTCIIVYNVQIGTYIGEKKVSTFLKLEQEMIVRFYVDTEN